MTPEERLKRKNEFDANLRIGVRRFNLTTGRKEHLERTAVAVDVLIDPSTGLLRKELSLERSCPVCEGVRSGRVIFIKCGFRHLKCSQCGMIYVNPVLKEEHLHSFYLDEESYAQILCHELQIEMDRKKFEYGLDLVEEYVPQRGRLIDVGCGPGNFLSVACGRGWQVQGIEFNRWCVQRLRDSGIEVVDVPLERSNLQVGAYQCVTLWDVLEHITRPGSFVVEIGRLLSAGGALLINVPNADSLVLRTLHEKSATFAGHAHINFFNAKTLTRLLWQSGFTVMQCETILTELGTINNYLQFEDPYFGEGAPVLDLLTPEYLHERLLGSRLLVIATKS